MTTPRIGIGGIIFESNSFGARIPRPQMFTGPTLRRGDAVFDVGPVSEYTGIRRGAEAVGATLVPLLSTTSGPAAPAPHSEYLAFRSLFLEALVEVEGSLDALVIPLHGAMTTEIEDDVEADFVAAVREVFGRERPIVVTHDLHAAPSERLIGMISALVGYKTCPHVDHDVAGERAVRIAAAAVRREVDPRVVLLPIPMLTPAEGHDTIDGPMAAMTQQIQSEAAAAGLLDESLFMCQPWLDTARSSWRLTAVIDRATTVADDAESLMRAHARRIWELRPELKVEKVPVSAVAAALRAHPDGRPLLVADGGDSPTAGSAGDSSDLLQALISADDPRPRLAVVVDPEAAERAVSAGIGAEIQVSLGGALSGLTDPVEVQGVVGAVSDGTFMRIYPAEPEDLGDCATLVVGQTTILLASRPLSMLDQTSYRHIGLDPQAFHAIQVKSAGGFRARWADVSTDVLYVDTRGASDSNLVRLPFRKLPRPTWPFDAVEHPEKEFVA